MYQLASDSSLVRLADGAVIPRDPANADYQAFVAWEAGGNAPQPYSPPPPTIEDVAAERTRRLALGFDYDFGDARGIHHIGTADADMMGWDEVTKATQAAMAIGEANVTWVIVTNTGPATVTATEWQRILLAASAARQPLWAASFALEAMPPIPADFKADRYWAR